MTSYRCVNIDSIQLVSLTFLVNHYAGSSHYILVYSIGKKIPCFVYCQLQLKSAALVLTHDKESHLTLIVSIVVIMTSSGAWINLFSTRSGTFGVTVLTGVCITNSDRCEQVWILADFFEYCWLFSRPSVGLTGKLPANHFLLHI